MATATPRVRVEAACRELGRSTVIRRCADVLAGGSESAEFLLMLGGVPAMRLLEAGLPEHQSYWLRVWAARGLLWTGPGEHAATVSAALDDASWRVREMACKVIGRHGVGDLLARVIALESDPVARVRVAASRAAVVVVQSEV